MEGLFRGAHDRFNEVVIGTRDGVVKAQTAKRLDGVQRIDAELVRETRETPWGLVPGDPSDEDAVPLAMVPHGPATPQAASGTRARPRCQEPVLETRPCVRAGCPTLMLGRRQAVPSTARRARIESVLISDGDVMRIEEAPARKSMKSEAMAVPNGVEVRRGTG